MTVLTWFLQASRAFCADSYLNSAVERELAGDRRAGHRGHLDEVEVCLLRQPERVTDGDDADLLTVRTDQAHLVDADAVVDPGLSADGASSGFHSCSRRTPDTRKARDRSSRKPNTQPAPDHPTRVRAGGDAGSGHPRAPDRTGTRLTWCGGAAVVRVGGGPPLAHPARR